MNHPDFRVCGKIFASLALDGTWGMVKLASDQQAIFCRAEPAVFEAFAGAWGRSGCTKVHIKPAKVATVKEALALAREFTLSKQRGKKKSK